MLQVLSDNCATRPPLNITLGIWQDLIFFRFPVNEPMIRHQHNRVVSSIAQLDDRARVPIDISFGPFEPKFSFFVPGSVEFISEYEYQSSRFRGTAASLPEFA